MTAPSLNTTFDTSLVDVQRSFSSTETNTSQGSSVKENQPPSQQGRIYRQSTTQELYGEWANTYDSDGNFLQAVDDIQSKGIIPTLVRTAHEQSNASSESLKILDLGCGTGRTTVKLIQQSWGRPVTIEAWDASMEMLSLAEIKCSTITKSPSYAMGVKFRRMDLTDPTALPSDVINTFDLVVSTLVLEHIPQQTYWTCISKLLKRGGIGFVSNMHEEVGRKSVAGFQDSQGRRVVGHSYVHGVQETVDAAKQAGLDVVGDVREVAITEGMLANGSVGPRGSKWLGTNVWYGFCFRKR